MKKPSHKGLDKKTLKLWAEIGRLRSDNICELCGKKSNTQAHHFFGRKNKSVRYDLENLISLCYFCHKGSPLSAHESPMWFQEQIVKKRGRKWLTKLTTKWAKPIKWDSFYIKEKYEELLEEKNRLTKDIKRVS